MENSEKDIIRGALGMFNKYGIRSVTMDDVAREQSISKKTIYKFFENKADLVHKSVITIYEEVREALEEIRKKTGNAIDELIEVNRIMSDLMENHNPSLRFQLQKYYPKTYAKVYEGTNEHIHKIIASNIKKGKAQGVYRQEINTMIVTYLYCSKMERIPEDEEGLLEGLSMRVIAKEALEYHIRGIATAKGLEYMTAKIKDDKSNQ